MARRLRTQTEYKPVFEDWLFRVLLPLGAHVMLAVSALAARARVREALFGLERRHLLLLFIGIHSALDSVAYHLFAKKL